MRNPNEKLFPVIVLRRKFRILRGRVTKSSEPTDAQSLALLQKEI